MEAAAKTILDVARTSHFSLENWSANPLHPSDPNESTVDWIFVLDSLNFSFWPDSDELFTGASNLYRFLRLVDFHGKLHTGYWSLVAAINRALEV